MKIKNKMILDSPLIQENTVPMGHAEYTYSRRTDPSCKYLNSSQVTVLDRVCQYLLPSHYTPRVSHAKRYLSCVWHDVADTCAPRSESLGVLGVLYSYAYRICNIQNLGTQDNAQKFPWQNPVDVVTHGWMMTIRVTCILM